MEGRAENHDDILDREQATAKVELLAGCGKLTAAGVRFVAVHFDGHSDEGRTEAVKCYVGDWFAPDEREPARHHASHLQDYFETLVPFGYQVSGPP